MHLDFLKMLIQDAAGVHPQYIHFEVPPSVTMGDFALPCFAIAQQKNMSPTETASSIASALHGKEGVRRVDAVGPYVNIFVDTPLYAEKVLRTVITQKERYGRKPKKKEAVLVEFCSPNTNKPLHLGHLRNIALGESLSRIFEALGHTVYRHQIINDRGIHIAKSLVAYRRWGNNEQPSSQLRGDYLVGKYYVMYHEKEDASLKREAEDALRKWEGHDPDVRVMTAMLNGWAEDGFNQTLERLGVHFYTNFYESAIYESGKNAVLKALQEGIVSKRADGAVEIDLSDARLDKKVLLRQDGTSVYITQDIGLAVVKQDQFRDATTFLYVVGSEQEYHFRVLFEIIKRLGVPHADRYHHVSYGMVNLPEGKMKSREGNVVDADEIVDEVLHLARQEIEKRKGGPADARRAEMIGLGALFFMLLKPTVHQPLLYDPKESVSFFGDTGPYAQYAYARIQSVLRKSGRAENIIVDTSRLGTEADRVLLRLIDRFPDVVERAAELKDPSHIAQYVIELAQSFNTYYHQHKVIGESEERSRLALVAAVGYVIKNSLFLLGIESPERM